jgi:diguanylate cyclase (GGDEF)-like protein
VATDELNEGDEPGVLDLRHQVIDLRQQLAASEDRFRSIVDRSTDGIIIVDGSGTVRFASQAAEAMLGRPAGELLGHVLGSPVMAGDIAEMEVVRPSGEVRYVEMRGVETTWERGPAFLILLRDMTERHQREDDLGHLATHDSLTGLPNRYLLDDRLAHAVARVGRSGEAIAVMFVDLDDFKVINDRFGHAAGDQVLAETARRILGILRPADTVARVGGDEFVVVCEAADQAMADGLAARLYNAIRQPLVVGDQQVIVRASIGVALGGHDASDPETLLAAADDAMYRDKQRVRTDPRTP